MTRHACAVVLLLALAGAAGCSRHAVEEVETKAPSPVSTITLAPQTVEGVVAASGMLRSR